MLRIVPGHNSFKVELVYQNHTDISNLENLHELREYEFTNATKALELAIKIKKGTIASQLKSALDTEQNEETSKKLTANLELAIKLKKNYLPQIFKYTNSGKCQLIEPKPRTEPNTPLLPSYTKGLNRQEFIDNAIIFAGIDTGINNFVALAILADHKKENEQLLNELGILNKQTEAKLFNGKPIKSQIKYLGNQLDETNSTLQHFKPGKHTSNKINNIYQKREHILDNLCKQAAAEVLKHCLKNHVQVLTVGYNPGWKQRSKLHRSVKDLFELIPFKRFIDYLVFKLEDQGILVETTEESYTSQTSVLDHEQPTKQYGDLSRRTSRGLLITNKQLQINADVNSAYQMIKKTKPDIEYNSSLIDTRGSFFKTFKKQHTDTVSIQNLKKESLIIGKTRYYLAGATINQTKVFTSKQTKYRQNYERLYTVMIA